MKLITQYPTGAFHSIDSVRGYIGTAKRAGGNITLWRLFDVGHKGIIDEYRLLTNARITPRNDSNFVEGVQRHSVNQPGYWYEAYFSLLDCNVVLNRYNDHFLFSDIVEASEYSEHIKKVLADNEPKQFT